MKKFLLMITFLWMTSDNYGQNMSKDVLIKDKIQLLSDDHIFQSPDYFNWCSSIIKDNDGQYHLFYSRWKKEYGFTGWLTHSEIAHAVSDKPLGPWTYKETVMSGRGKGHWDAITAHNPMIKEFEGKYYLYYVSTQMNSKDYTESELIETAKIGYTHPNWKILRPNQRTGVAVASNLNGPWARMDKPLIEPSGPITTLTVNPSIAQGKDGKYYLIVKGDKPNETRFIRNQAVAISESPTGPFIMQSKAVIEDLDTEDLSVWYDRSRDSFYAVFHAHTFIGMIQSKDGVNWEQAPAYKISEKKVKKKDGSFLLPDRLERPFIFLEQNEPRVLSMAVKKGNDAYIIFLPIEQSIL
ncbi:MULTISPECIES: glycoside hydrolase family protein [Sphingobacterium]|uniref:glycoside hydrolase family protein n=1 Tax=Sphingobacterium TaxID=28453 RepID=UPI0013DAAEBA|nr:MULTISPECIES: glycoside hydrolase family protein [unclassified Sphingobacterium]